MNHVLALCGGVGGAKLAHGLAAVLGEDELTIVVNTGDDFEHLGLAISPDIDTVLYTLSGLADRERGWGRAGETWGFMAALEALGGETWFNLGDHDLAMHVERTRRLAGGASLSEVTAAFARAMAIRPAVVPMSDDPVRTTIDTDTGPLSFQHYFVRERCAPVARSIRYEGAATARPSAGFGAALRRKDLAAIIICPSNPYLSIDPILGLAGVREALGEAGAPIVAVSPIVGGQAIKGPAAKLMGELGVQPAAAAIAAHYRGLIHGLVLDIRDEAERGAVEATGVRALAVPSVMRSDADRAALARDCLAFARRLADG
ncbi:MAG: 2-phospho-L-lactate transferase [Parcubacteria group bacterium]